MRYLSAADPKEFQGKTCLLRVDFNVENRKEDFRLFAVLPTIHWLLRADAKVVLLSHRGRPEQTFQVSNLKFQVSPDETLKIIIPFLKNHLKTPVKFFPNLDVKKINRATKKAAPGSLFLVENLRLFAGETNNDPAFAQTLSQLGEIYVSDAFSVCHRAHASVATLPTLLPSYAGLLLEREVRSLTRVLNTHEKPLVLIIGGAKASDKIGVVEHFLPKADAILVGGAAANTFLKARGDDIKSSHYEPAMADHARSLLHHHNIILPTDFVEHEEKYLDIGPETVKAFVKKLKAAKTIVWNGPMGMFEDGRFAAGSRKLARAIVKTHAFTLAGGGETTQLITKMKLGHKFSFLSTGGGAMLAFLAGKKLPGIEALS